MPLDFLGALGALDDAQPPVLPTLDASSPAPESAPSGAPESPLHAPNQQILQTMLMVMTQNLTAFNTTIAGMSTSLAQRIKDDTTHKTATDYAINAWATAYIGCSLAQARVQDWSDAIAALQAARTTYLAARAAWLTAWGTWRNAILAGVENTYWATVGTWRPDFLAYANALDTYNTASTTYEAAVSAFYVSLATITNPASTTSLYATFTNLKTACAFMYQSGQFLAATEVHDDRMTAWAGTLQTALSQLAGCLSQAQILSVLATLA